MSERLLIQHHFKNISRRSPNRILMATSTFGPYVPNQWTDWADNHLLKSPDVLRFIKGNDYSFWLRWFNNWVASTDSSQTPLLQHIPEVTQRIGMKPLWAMSQEEKHFTYCPEGTPWAPKFFLTRKPLHCKEALQLCRLGNFNLEPPFRLERECFPDMSGSSDELEPVFIERLYHGERDDMLVFSVIKQAGIGEGWLLRCGNQVVESTDDWRTNFSIQLPELNIGELCVEHRFHKATKRLLRLRSPYAFVMNDPKEIVRRGYDTRMVE